MSFSRTQAISTEDEATSIARRAREHGRLGIDTEFMPEGRYRPLLCLVQVIVGDEVTILDPLSGFEFEPLLEVFADPDVEIVLHAGRQDVAILRREWGAEFTNVFDTQIAAGFAGFSAQAGYNGLLHDVIKKRLEKSASFTRWDMRPLTDEQLRYAREDVEHLLQLADAIQAKLDARGRLQWAREECHSIAEATDERDPGEAWLRLPRATGLGSRDRAVARELCAWRERKAAEEDKPVGNILRDPTVVELAKRQPTNKKALAEVRGVTAEVMRRRADEVLATIERGRKSDPIRLPERERLSTDSHDAPAIALAEALVRARAVEAGLAYQLVASRADLTQIVVVARRHPGEEPVVRTLQGWRRELVGEELLQMLRGETSLRVGENGRVEIF